MYRRLFVPLNFCMQGMSGKQELIPLQILLKAMLGEAVDCIVKGDQVACIIALTKGYSPSLRHLTKTQHIAMIFVQRRAPQRACDHGEEVHPRETRDHKDVIFTQRIHPAQVDHTLDLILVGCKAIAPTLQVTDPGKGENSDAPERSCPHPPSSANGQTTWATIRRRRSK